MKINVLVTLGGELSRNQFGGWSTTILDNGCDSIEGKSLRVIASSYFYKKHPNILVIASGKGRCRDKTDLSYVSNIVKKELMELGVPLEKIIEENKSENSYEQLKEVNKFIKEQNFKRIVLISNEYHLPRIKSFINYFEEFENFLKRSNLYLISAERILMKYFPTIWTKKIKELYEHPEMKRIIESEIKGINDIENGIYKL